MGIILVPIILGLGLMALLGLTALVGGWYE